MKIRPVVQELDGAPKRGFRFPVEAWLKKIYDHGNMTIYLPGETQ